MPSKWRGYPLRALQTYSGSRAVQHADCDYVGEVHVHLTLCTLAGEPFRRDDVARLVCASVRFCCDKLRFRLYGYCLMPDHLHVLLSPAESDVAVSEWLRRFKSFTTNQYQKTAGEAGLWQRSAHDHVCRTNETAETVLAYVVNNPVRAGLVEDWRDWTYTEVFVEL